MRISRKPWDGSQWNGKSAEAYCKACLIDLNKADAKTPTGKKREGKIKALCKLPVYEPNGALNVNALHAKAAELAGARGGMKGVPAAEKRKAARKLVRLYRQVGEVAPASIYRLAGLKRTPRLEAIAKERRAKLRAKREGK